MMSADKSPDLPQVLSEVDITRLEQVAYSRAVGKIHESRELISSIFLCGMAMLIFGFFAFLFIVISGQLLGY